MNAITLDYPVTKAELRSIADRLGNPIGRGTRIVYARGSLPVLCGGSTSNDSSANTVEAAYRAVRGAAMDAYEVGRVTLVQRLVETDAKGLQTFDYIAVGLV